MEPTAGETQQPSQELIDSVTAEVLSNLESTEPSGNGTARTADSIDGLTDRIDSLERELLDIETDSEGLDDELQQATERLDTLSAITDPFDDVEELTALLEELAELADRLDDNESLVTVIDRVDSITDRVGSLEQWQDDLSRAHMSHSSTPADSPEETHHTQADIEVAFEDSETPTEPR